MGRVPFFTVREKYYYTLPGDTPDHVAPFLLYVFNRSLKEGYIPPSQKRALVFPSLKKPNFTLLTARTSDQFPTCHSSLRLLNVWSRFPILKILAFRPTNLASEPPILPKRLYCLFSLTFTLLLTNCSSPYWPCLMYLLLSTWSTTKSSLSVLRPRVESHHSLFFGSNLTSLTVLK